MFHSEVLFLSEFSISWFPDPCVPGLGQISATKPILMGKQCSSSPPLLLLQQKGVGERC